MFFPAAGFWNGNNVNYEGDEGNYWSSTPDTDTSYAWGLNFNSDNQGVPLLNRANSNNVFGRSVRAVLAEHLSKASIQAVTESVLYPTQG